jgi:hypothetical protein
MSGLIAESKNAIIKIIQENSELWSNPGIVRSLQMAGVTFNIVDENLFDRVFVVPSDTHYRASSADVLKKNHFLKMNHPLGLKEFFITLHSAVENFAGLVIENSHLPGYTVTTEHLCERQRIPIHIHKGWSEGDTAQELTLSIALNLKMQDVTPARIRFYNTSSSHDRVQENLWPSDDYIEIPLLEPVTTVLFSANSVPHTVLFNQDLIVWAVFNGASQKQKQFPNPLKKIQRFL